MSQNFPARQDSATGYEQQSVTALSVISGFSNRHLVVVLTFALCSASQSATGYPTVARKIIDKTNTTSITPDRTSIAALCKPGCVTVIDFQNDRSKLEFSRTYPAARWAGNDFPARWRHRYDIRLTRQNDDRIVFDHHGARHLFRLDIDGTYAAEEMESGHLVLLDGQYVWTDRHATRHRFHGSFPTLLRFADNQTLTLRYQAGQLLSVTDDENGKITFVHDNGSLDKVLLPDGRVLHHPGDPCFPRPEPTTHEEEPPPEHCDTQENPVTGFANLETRPGVSVLDARPASCQSYFVEFYGTVRGEEIESGLEFHPPYSAMVPTNRSFPIIDFIDGNTLIVVRSRDVASPTYNNPDSPDALYERLLRDGEQIQTRALDPLASEGVLSGTENGSTTLITHGEQQRVVLHLLIRQGMASASHWQQIETARTALAALYGIRLQVVIIP